MNCAGNSSTNSPQAPPPTLTEPHKKSYFAKHSIDGPLKFSTSVNSSAGSLNLNRKDSARLVKQPVLVGSASSKNIQTVLHTENKQLMFKSFVQKGGEPQPLQSKLSTFARHVGEPRLMPVQPPKKMESEYGRELLRKLTGGDERDQPKLDSTLQHTKPTNAVVYQQQPQQAARLASPETVLTFRKPIQRSPLQPDNIQSKERVSSNSRQFFSKEVILDKKQPTFCESQKELSIYLAETSTSISSLVWKTHLQQHQENTASAPAISHRKIQSLKHYEPVMHAYTKRLSQSLRLEDFTVVRQLGKGKFGKVSLVVHNSTGFLCAMKAIEKDTIRKENLAGQLARQIKIQLFLKHENIASLYGYFDDEQYIYLLMQLCTDGQLHELLKVRKRLSEKQARPMIRQLCEAVDYLHRNSILHRDIKPQNILIQNEVLKLCDFGWSVKMETTMRDTFCGTPLYVSPEILKGDKYDEKIDIWSIGVLTYEMVVGRIPFRIRNEQDLQKIVLPTLIQITDSIVFPQYVPLSPEVKSFISSIMQKNPQQRLDLEALLHHPFLLG